MAAVDTPRQTTPAPAATPASNFADPGPLGLAAFALTTFFLSSVNAGLIPKTVEGAVLGLALFYGGIAQLLAGMWEFAKSNTFGALAFTSYGAFWLSFWYLVAHTDLSAAGADASKGVGTFLLAWTIFTAYMTIASSKVSGVVFAVFVALLVTFVLLTWGEYSGTAGITKTGGWIGLLTAVLAWYGSFAGVANSTFKRPAFPTFPR
ncbi:MAG: acetate uptake transporter [Motilibacteraceae bacterium]